MAFSTDRDLLVFEPDIFQDVPLSGQELLRLHDAQAQGTILSSASADFEALGLESGHVATLAGVPMEIVQCLDAHSLRVSLLRPTLESPPRPGPQGETLDLIVRTFAPQAAAAHACLLHLLQIDTSAPAAASAAVLARVETLGTLGLIYAAAVALSGDNADLWRKANIYRRRYQSTLHSTFVKLDLDHDGIPETLRHLGVTQLIRM